MLKIKLNDDVEMVKQVQLSLKDNKGYCPCKLIKSKDTICMCKEFREQNYPGKCHCELYIKYIEE